MRHERFSEILKHDVSHSGHIGLFMTLLIFPAWCSKFNLQVILQGPIFVFVCSKDGYPQAANVKKPWLFHSEAILFI